MRSNASTTLNARAGLAVRAALRAEPGRLQPDRREVSDIDYFYASRLPGEPAEGVADIHTHPLEPRSFRLSLTLTF